MFNFRDFTSKISHVNCAFERTLQQIIRNLLVRYNMMVQSGLTPAITMLKF
jgi:hypothetical protein